MEKKQKKPMLSAFSIILILIILLGIISHFLPTATFVKDQIVDGSGVVPAKVSDVLMSPILGFESAVDVCIFVIILGGFLAIVSKTGALETGVKVLVQKLKGKEIILIPILMCKRIHPVIFDSFLHHMMHLLLLIRLYRIPLMES